MLDVVITRDDLPAPTVDVLDVGLSDHRLLRWQVPMGRTPPVYLTTVILPWRLLDHDLFRQELMSSPTFTALLIFTIPSRVAIH